MKQNRQSKPTARKKGIFYVNMHKRLQDVSSVWGGSRKIHHLPDSRPFRPGDAPVAGCHWPRFSEAALIDQWIKHRPLLGRCNGPPIRHQTHHMDLPKSDVPWPQNPKAVYHQMILIAILTCYGIHPASTRTILNNICTFFWRKIHLLHQAP